MRKLVREKSLQSKLTRIHQKVAGLALLAGEDLLALANDHRDRCSCLSFARVKLKMLLMAEYLSPHMGKARSGATRVRGMPQDEVQPNHPTSDDIAAVKVDVVMQKMKRVVS